MKNSTLYVKEYAAVGDALRIRDALAALTRDGRNPLAGQVMIVVPDNVSDAVLDILRSTGCHITAPYKKAEA
jgi:hypothetical protein